MTQSEAHFFHERARLSFDQRGEQLLSALSHIPPTPGRMDFQPERIVRHTFTEKDLVGNFSYRKLASGTYEPEVIGFLTTSGMYGLQGDHCREFLELASSIQGVSILHRKISLHYVEKKLEEWLAQRHAGAEPRSISTFIEASVDVDVCQQEILLPICNLSIEAPLSLGPVTLIPITSGLLDELYSDLRTKCGTPDNLHILEDHENSTRSLIQGLAAASYSIEAEPQKAMEEALQATNDALAILRLLHPANSSPLSHLSCRPFAAKPIDGYRAFQITNEGMSETAQEYLPPPEDWKIPAADIPIFAVADRFLRAEKTDFRRKLMEVFLLYSRNSATREPTMKLVLVLVALETLLLRNQSEPIQQVLAQRIAHLLGKNVEQCIVIEKLVKQAYQLRSKFIHHGEEPKDLRTLSRFLQICWELMILLLHNHGLHSTKDDFLDYLHRLQYQRR